ncbi:MAG: Gfo/Idh/MocA family oxidoreductase [Roseitalea porphyridii]|uniref:Gfo/Idh/MocA family protein n=1 Tax=Roseitalea porphyridii TaxID=1852022 RepID=UPI0032ECBF93
MTLRYGVVGTGMMGQEHIRNIALLGEATVTAIADTREEMRHAGLAAAEQAGMAGVRAFADHKALLSSDLIDALLIVSPNDTHYQITLDALATNLPILLEKPSANMQRSSAARMPLSKSTTTKALSRTSGEPSS